MKSRLPFRLIPGLLLLPLLLTSAAEEAPAPPLKAELILKPELSLPADQLGETYRKKVQADPSDPVAATTVDAVFRLTNTSDKPVTIQVGGDATRFQWDIEGPGVVKIQPLLIMTQEFRMGAPVTIEPGKTHEMPLPRLESGKRGADEWAYLTDPGDYTLSCTYKGEGEGSGPFKISTEAVKLKVVGP